MKEPAFVARNVCMYTIVFGIKRKKRKKISVENSQSKTICWKRDSCCVSKAILRYLLFICL